VTVERRDGSSPESSCSPISADLHAAFSQAWDDGDLIGPTTFAAIDSGIGIVALIPLAVVAAALVCALVLVSVLAMGSVALWTLRRAAETVLGSAHDF
jgi:hypothetical protein